MENSYSFLFIFKWKRICSRRFLSFIPAPCCRPSPPGLSLRFGLKPSREGVSEARLGSFDLYLTAPGSSSFHAGHGPPALLLSQLESGQGDGARRPGTAAPSYKSTPRAPPRCPSSVPPLNSAAAAPHRMLGPPLFRVTGEPHGEIRRRSSRTVSLRSSAPSPSPSSPFPPCSFGLQAPRSDEPRRCASDLSSSTTTPWVSFSPARSGSPTSPSR